jgi:hypothetical protein
MSSPSRPASQALIRPSTSLRLISRVSSLSRSSFFSIGLSVEVRRDDRQVGERPLAALDLELLRRRDLDQVADRRRQHEVVALEEVAGASETAERLGDVGGDRWLLGNDQRLAHDPFGPVLGEKGRQS